jgi:hypothetical protein
MRLRHGLWAALAAAALLGAGQPVSSADGPVAKGEALQLVAGQTEYLTHEPILVTARLHDRSGFALQAGPGECKGKALRFEVTPPVKANKSGESLPLEAKGAGLPATVRTYDLLEWFQFPAEGTWTVQIVVERDGKTLKSAPLKITIRRPDKGDKEQAAVGRLHHLPWSNYTKNAFCGDTFDLVKQWPESRLARYAHYWNGVYSQNKKEYTKAIESFRAATKYPGFVLADHADYGIVECLSALGRLAEASNHREALLRRLQQREGKGEVSTIQLFARPVQAEGVSAGGR